LSESAPIDVSQASSRKEKKRNEKRLAPCFLRVAMAASSKSFVAAAAAAGRRKFFSSAAMSGAVASSSGTTTATTTTTKKNQLLLHSEWVHPQSPPPNEGDENNTATITNNNDATIVFLHGLLGNGRNVKTMARKLCRQQQQQQRVAAAAGEDAAATAAAASVRGLLLDIRGHGRSKLPPPSSSLLLPSSGSLHRLHPHDHQHTHDHPHHHRHLQHDEQERGFASTGEDGSANGAAVAGLRPTSSFADCARDIQLTLQSRGVVAGSTTAAATAPTTLVGHSLGGRLALQYAADRLEPRPSRIWLLDTVPGAMNRDVRDVVDALQRFANDHRSSRLDGSESSGDGSGSIRNSDGSIPSRKEVAGRLLEYGRDDGTGRVVIDKGMADWLASSFDDKVAGTFEFDLSVVRDLIDSFERQDFMSQLRQVVVEDGIRVDLVRGLRNPAWNSDRYRRSREAKELDELSNDRGDAFRVHTLPDAGHWVHVDDLPGLLKAMEG